MQVGSIKNTPFKGFYNVSAELEKNIPLSRGIIDIFGSDIPWLVMANNNSERKEKARRMISVFLLIFISPIVMLPLFNRAGMKWGSKLAKSFWSNNHKAIHISNKDLVNTEKMEAALKKLSEKYEYSPLETAWAWLTRKKLDHKPLDFSKMLEGDKEKLRRKLVNTKNGVMSADYLFCSLSLGSIPFINNGITKKQTGQSGFSAEFSMADKEIVEKRAQQYEKSWKYRYGAMLSAALALGAGIPLAVRHGLLAKDGGKFAKFMNKQASKFDYEKGIYMSRWSLLLGNVICCHGGALLANRNSTERKDNALRFGMADALFFGGDVVVGSVFGHLSDRFLKTDLIDKSAENLKRAMPRLRHMSDLVKPYDRKIACGLYWLNLATISAAMGFVVPAIANAITRKDVRKDVEKYGQFNNDFLWQAFRQEQRISLK